MHVEAVEEIAAERRRRRPRPSDRRWSRRRSGRRRGGCRSRRCGALRPLRARAAAWPARPSASSRFRRGTACRPTACSISPGRAPRGAGEGAARVAEELVLEQRLGQRGAVQRDERTVGARAAGVHRARRELLAGAGLPGDEDRARDRRPRGGSAPSLAHRLAVADERVDRPAGADVPLQQIDLARQLPALRRRRERASAARRGRTASARSRPRRASSPRPPCRRCRSRS